MKKFIVFRILSVLILVLLPMLAVTLAYADTHFQEVIPIDDTWTENPCGFDIEIHDYGTLRINYWVDENGNRTREMWIFGRMRETVSANGKSFDVNIQGPAHIEYISENEVIFIVTGAIGLATVPGYGRIFGGAGSLYYRVTYDQDSETWTLFRETGNYFEDWEAVCEYLAP